LSLCKSHKPPPVLAKRRSGTQAFDIKNQVASKYSSLPQALPLQFALYQNFPNPFNPETWIPFSLAKDAAGEQVAIGDLMLTYSGIYPIK
jgi:hypothetical protein